MTITTRAGKGSELTWAELDANFTELAAGMLPWINVAAQGSIAAAVAAVNATANGAVLYFPAGTYTSAGGHVFTKMVRIVGDGCADCLGTAALTTINCTSATANMFTFTVHGSAAEKVHIKNTAGSTPTAGSGIYVTYGNGTRFLDISVSGFFRNVDVENAAEWYMTNSFMYEWVDTGCRIRNVALPDGGDSGIVNCQFVCKTHASVYSIHATSGGGIRLVGNKFNFRSGSVQNHVRVEVAAGVLTSVFVCTGNSFENMSREAIKFTNAAGTRWGLVNITGNEFAFYGPTTYNAISIVANALGDLNGVVLGPNVFECSPGASVAAIQLTNIGGISIAESTFHGFSKPVNATNVVDLRNANARYGALELTDAATIGVDQTNAENLRVTLGGNRTLARPQTLCDGQVINIRVKQDGTGGRTLAYAAGYKFPGGVAPVLSTAPNAVDLLSTQYDSTDDTWFLVANKAFS